MHNEPREQRPLPWAPFVTFSAAIYLTTLYLSVINVALPDIFSDFDISPAAASWIVNNETIIKEASP